jgi:hypothetical protein
MWQPGVFGSLSGEQWGVREHEKIVRVPWVQKEPVLLLDRLVFEDRPISAFDQRTKLETTWATVREKGMCSMEDLICEEFAWTKRCKINMSFIGL